MIVQKNQGRGSAADEIRPEYDPRGGIRGKYYERYKQGTNVVLLEPGIAKVFRDQEYWRHCEIGGHPRPKAHFLLPENLPRRGDPFSSSEGAWM